MNHADEYRAFVIEVMKIATVADLTGNDIVPGFLEWRRLAHDLFAAIVSTTSGVLDESELLDLADVANRAAIDHIADAAELEGRLTAAS